MIKATRLAVLSASVAALTSAAPALAQKGSADPLTDWAVERMTVWSPLKNHAALKESPDDAKARYAEIARAARDVAFDPKEAPLFPGADGRSRTMSVLLAIASLESGGFQRNVDLGIGDGVGDGGRSWCLMQIRLSELSQSTKRTWYRVSLDERHYSYVYGGASGWGGEDLVADRSKCFRAGLHMVRKSFDIMASSPVKDRLAVYASGKPTTGFLASQRRMSKALEWLDAVPPPQTDAAVLKALAVPQDPPRIASSGV